MKKHMCKMHLIDGKNLWKDARKNITFSFSENFIKQKAEKRHSKQEKIRTGFHRSGQKNAGKEVIPGIADVYLSLFEE